MTGQNRVPRLYREFSRYAELVLEVIQEDKDLGLVVRKQHTVDLDGIDDVLSDDEFPKTREFFSFVANKSLVLTSERKGKHKEDVEKRMLELAVAAIEEIEEDIESRIWDTWEDEDLEDIEAINSLIVESLDGVRRVLEWSQDNNGKDLPEQYEEYLITCLETYMTGVLKWQDVLGSSGMDDDERTEAYNRIRTISEGRERLDLVGDAEIQNVHVTA